MTATERLRRILDEQGVEWAEALTDLSRQTHWGTERYWCAFTEWNGTVDIADTLTVYHLTPEQAVEATLGRGTCRIPETRIDHGSIEYNGMTAWRRCSACGAEVLASPPHYCPNCGRRVEP